MDAVELKSRGRTRAVIEAVSPEVDGGRFPAKALPGEDLRVSATVFREGHDQLGVSAVLLDPRGKERQRVGLAPSQEERWKGLDRWEGHLTPTGVGAWSFVIEAWHDRYGTWHHNAEVKVAAGIDVELMLTEGSVLLAEAAGDDAGRSAAEKRTLRAASVVLADTTKSPEERLAAGFSREVLAGDQYIATGGYLLARCAGKAHYFDVIDAIYRDQVAIHDDLHTGLLTIAKSVGMTQDQFNTCLRSPENLKALDDRLALAEADQVEATPQQLTQTLFAPEARAHALMCEQDGRAIGYAVYFFNYSTWQGRHGLYLEDLYIDPAARGSGAGKALLQHLARIAVDRDCGRFEWSVLDWNQPAIDFYESLQARPQSEWVRYRLTGDALLQLAGPAR